jgi:hypothetical protein
VGEGKGHCRDPKETNDVRLGPAQDRGSTACAVGEGQSRKESGLKETRPRIQSAPLSLIHLQLKIGTENQRSPLSHPQRFFSAIQQKGTRKYQWNKEQ